MFTKHIFTILLLLITITVNASIGSIKEGGGYGVKPISELIKESDDGLHTSIDIAEWLVQRDQNADISTILKLYRQAINIRKQVIEIYEHFSGNPEEIKHQILFIQGLLIIKLENIKYLELTNDIRKTAAELPQLSAETMKIIGARIEDGYLVVDLLKKHIIKQIETNLPYKNSFYLN